MNNLVIDGSNLLWRTHWVASTRPPLINSKNEWTGPVYLFLKSVKSLHDKFKPDNVWITWDKKLNYPSTNYRKQLAPETYKQNRDNEKTLKVHEQHDKLNPFLKALGIKQMYPWVLEADDIISWLVREKLTTTIIVSVDKDLLQLVDSNIHYYNPIKKKLITPENFVEEVGVEINEYNFYKALLGDKSDNVGGIPGYGVQKSSKLCKEGYDGIVAKLTDEDRKKFDTNLLLINLYGSYLKEENEQNCYEEQFLEQQNILPNIKTFESLCLEAEFFSIVKDLDRWKQAFSRDKLISDLISRLL